MRTATEVRQRANAEQARAVTAADHAYAEGWQNTADHLHNGATIDTLRQQADRAMETTEDWPLEQARAHGMRQAVQWLTADRANEK